MTVRYVYSHSQVTALLPLVLSVCKRIMGKDIGRAVELTVRCRKFWPLKILIISAALDTWLTSS
ncbi:hypothetical protein YC2023_092735 [Brassica napus]